MKEVQCSVIYCDKSLKQETHFLLLAESPPCLDCHGRNEAAIDKKLEVGPRGRVAAR